MAGTGSVLSGTEEDGHMHRLTKSHGTRYLNGPYIYILCVHEPPSVREKGFVVLVS